MLHAKLKLPSSTIVNVTADGMISRLGFRLLPYEACCSAREGSLSCCGRVIDLDPEGYGRGSVELWTLIPGLWTWICRFINMDPQYFECEWFMDMNSQDYWYWFAILWTWIIRVKDKDQHKSGRLWPWFRKFLDLNQQNYEYGSSLLCTCMGYGCWFSRLLSLICKVLNMDPQGYGHGSAELCILIFRVLSVDGLGTWILRVLDVFLKWYCCGFPGLGTWIRRAMDIIPRVMVVNSQG